MREHLKISDAPIEVQAGGTPVAPVGGSPIANWSLSHYILAVMAIVVAAMLVFPPYRVLGPQGIIHRTGYAFIFDLPNRASVDVGQLFVQWVGVLIVGVIAYVLLSKRA